MLSTILESLEEDRAKFVRELEYIKEDMKESELADYTEYAEHTQYRESTEEIKGEIEEAVEVLKQIDPDDSLMEMEEIHRILTADHNLTFDEMVGID